MAVNWPGSAVKLMSLSTGLSAPGYRNSTFRNSNNPLGTEIWVIFPSGPDSIEGSVSSTDKILSAEASARGNHDKHPHGNHHRNHDLHDVCEESCQVTNGHGSAVDSHATKPNNGNHGQVHDGH